MSCIVTGCKNKKGSHSLPVDKERKSKWLEAMKLSPEQIKRKTVLLCSEHFQDSDYNSYHMEGFCQQLRKTLNRHAVPSIFPWSATRIETTEEVIVPAAAEEIISISDSEHESQVEPQDPSETINHPAPSSYKLRSAAAAPAKTNMIVLGETSSQQQQNKDIAEKGKAKLKTQLPSGLNEDTGADQPSTTVAQPRPCSSCLSYGRHLEPLNDLTNIYSTLVLGTKNLSDVKVCWECRGALQRCAFFQKQAARAQAILSLTENGTLPKITDNSRSLSTMAKVEVALMNMVSEVEEEDITAINVQTSVPKDRLKLKYDAMNSNKKTGTLKQKKVVEASSVANIDAISVEVKVPEVTELEEPLCEIVDFISEIDDPLGSEFDKQAYKCSEEMKTALNETGPTTSLEKINNKYIKLIVSKEINSKKVFKRKMSTMRDDGVIEVDNVCAKSSKHT